MGLWRVNCELNDFLVIYSDLMDGLSLLGGVLLSLDAKLDVLDDLAKLDVLIAKLDEDLVPEALLWG